MTYFFVNTYQTLFQCIALHTFSKQSVFYISNQCVNHLEIKSVLEKNGISCLIDNEYLRRTKLQRFCVHLQKFIFYNIFKLKKLDKTLDVYINGSISSKERLKFVAKADKIHYLDGGYQHYKYEFLGLKNYFYRRVNSSGLASYFRYVLGFRLNYEDQNVVDIIYINKTLANESDCVAAVKSAGKYREEFFLIEELLREQYKKSIIKELFPDFNFQQTYKNSRKKTICILTQPFSEDGYMSLESNIDIYRVYLADVVCEDVVVYLKIHPRESNVKYQMLAKEFDLIKLDGRYPFELFEAHKIIFDVGVSVNSTATYSSCFKTAVFLEI